MLLYLHGFASDPSSNKARFLSERFRDAGIPMEDIEAMRRALEQAKSKSEIVVYPKAPHGFFADYRDSYRPDDAADGWKRLLAWFERFGVA